MAEQTTTENAIKNKNSNFLYLNSDKPILIESSCHQDIFVSVEKLCTPFISRQTRRKEQSLAARVQLDGLITAHFGKHQASLWSLSKLSNGKPVLEGVDAPSISIAHSHDWVACVISPAPAVGIDVEKIREIDWDECYAYVLHSSEAEWLMQEGSEHEKNIRGLTLWCLKEAAVKAVGDSLNYGLTELAFSRDGCLLVAPSIFGAVSNWKSHTMVIDNDAVLAMVWSV